MGRMPVIMEAAKRLKSMLGGTVAVVGAISAPLSLAQHLTGPSLVKMGKRMLFLPKEGYIRPGSGQKRLGFQKAQKSVKRIRHHVVRRSAVDCPKVVTGLRRIPELP